MNSYLLYVVVTLAIAIPLMVLFRRHEVRKQEADMREQKLLQDNVLTGVKAMRGEEIKRQPTASRSKPVIAKPTPTRVERSTDNTPDDLLLFSAAHLASTPSTNNAIYTDDEPRKYAGGGGTFDGGGSSGNWSEPTRTSCASDNSPAQSNNDSSSSCSSSDSGSSGSSD